jgi:integrase
MTTILSTFVYTGEVFVSTQKDTRHLKPRGNIWWYQRRVPKHLINHYPDQSFIQVSLDTADIREARRKRDILNGELESKAYRANASSEGHRFRELVREMERDRKNHPDEWDLAVFPELLEQQGRKLELEAYMTVNGARDFSGKYKMRMSEAVQMWKEDWGKGKTEDTLQKVDKAVAEFGKFCFKHFDWIDQADVALEDISKKMVYQYIKYLEKSYKKATVQAKISRLKVVWEFAETMEEVQGTNPFTGHKYSSAEEHQTEKREPFTNDEMAVIRSHKWEKPVYKLLVDLGIYSGCRISELCNLKKKHVVVDEGIIAINIEKGKTKAATRTVPLPDFIGEQLLEHIKNKQDDDLVIGIGSKTASRTFSNFKTKHVTSNNLKGFHSFRHMYITAMERAGIEENVTAQIVGHERGKTMSYGYYSKGHELKALSHAVNKALMYLNIDYT